MNNIQYITVLPKTEYTALYYLNDSLEAHAKKITDLEDFILDKIGKKQYYIIVNKLLYSFQSFIIDVENKIITELESDRKKEFAEYRKTIKESKPIIRKENKSTLDRFNDISMKVVFPLHLDSEKKV